MPQAIDEEMLTTQGAVSGYALHSAPEAKTHVECSISREFYEALGRKIHAIMQRTGNEAAVTALSGKWRKSETPHGGEEYVMSAIVGVHPEPSEPEAEKP